MTDQLEVARSAGNVRDLGSAGVAAGPLKSMLAGKIVGILDDRRLTVRAAEEATGYAAADFSRIRQAKLSRFTVDRLMAILGHLDPTIELSVLLRPKITRDWAVAKLKAYENEIRAEGATALYLFGSAARDEAGPESDVDIFINYDPESKFTLLELAGIKVLLEEKLGVPFHVTTGNSLKPPLKDEIEREAIRVF